MSTVLSSAIHKSRQHHEKNSRERPESNPGLLGEKQVCYLRSIQSPMIPFFKRRIRWIRTVKIPTSLRCCRDWWRRARPRPCCSSWWKPPSPWTRCSSWGRRNSATGSLRADCPGLLVVKRTDSWPAEKKKDVRPNQNTAKQATLSNGRTIIIIIICLQPNLLASHFRTEGFLDRGLLTRCAQLLTTSLTATYPAHWKIEVRWGKSWIEILSKLRAQAWAFYPTLAHQLKKHDSGQTAKSLISNNAQVEHYCWCWGAQHFSKSSWLRFTIHFSTVCWR